MDFYISPVEEDAILFRILRAVFKAKHMEAMWECANNILFIQNNTVPSVDQVHVILWATCM
jgi:hypothetical protein